jgi:hypothetical protein
MALEVSEIAIRLAVGEPAHPSAPHPGQPAAAATLTPQQMEALVQACTRQVLQTLRMLEGR